jgi:hypothetical protein
LNLPGNKVVSISSDMGNGPCPAKQAARPTWPLPRNIVTDSPFFPDFFVVRSMNFLIRTLDQMSFSYYIYYRVDPARAEAAERRIRQLLDAVKKTAGTAGRLLKKRGEPNLWMEVYENVGEEACFERELAAAVNQLEATEFLQPGSGRHLECFKT